jgi:hypothetical protein
MLIGSIALFLAAILFAGFLLLPSLATAQQQQTTTTTVQGTTTTPLLPPPPSSSGTTGQATSPSLTSPPLTPLTPQEQEQQTRLQNVIAATNQNLEEVEKQIGGVVYTPRWSDPVWVEPDSAAVLIAYCLPGEFAESGQEILGGFELEVLESYEVALPQNFMAWMMVIGNEDRQNRLPAAVGVVCASDANNAETRVLSPQEEQQINNVVQQFTTIQNRQITSIDQVINIINNNATTTTTPQNGNTTTTTTPTAPSGGGEAPGATAPVDCPEGFDLFNPDTDQCEHPVSTEARCPPGFQFDPADDACVSIVDPPVPPVSVLCPPQTTFNPDTDQCKGTQTVPPTCPQGFDFNPATDQCEQIQTAPPAGSSSVGGITASLSGHPDAYEVRCPAFIQFSGTITDNVGNRDVRYRFIDSDGTIGPEQVIHFNEPGSQSVTYTSPNVIPPGLQGWVAIEILQPVQLQSNQAEYEIICTTPPPGPGVSSSDGTITATANPATYNGPCPSPLEFSGTITDNVGNRNVSYRFIFSIGAPTEEQVIGFDEPGSQTVSFTSFGSDKSLQGRVAIEILQPIQLQSNQAEFQITCTAPSMGALAANETITIEEPADNEEDTTDAAPTDGGGGVLGEGGGGGTTTEGGGTTTEGGGAPPATTDEEGAGDTGGGGDATDAGAPQ